MAASFNEMDRVVADFDRNRWRLGILFYRCAAIGPRFGNDDRASGGLRYNRCTDSDDVFVWRIYARTGVYLHVPMAAHPRCDDG